MDVKDVKRGEVINPNSDRGVTFDEASRRLNSITLRDLGLRFQDLSCNQIIVSVSSGQYQHRISEIDYDLGYPRIISYTDWTDQKDNLTVPSISLRHKEGEFEFLEEELKSISPSGCAVETEVQLTIHDYTYEDEAFLFVRIDLGGNKSILKITYPYHDDKSGTLGIIINPDDRFLQEKIEFFEKAIPLLVKKKMLPNITSDRVQIRFKDRFDETEVLNQFESIRSNFESYRLLFEKDLLSLKEIKTSDGFYRAIVYFLGPSCGLLFLQNTDINNLIAVSSHDRVLESWKNDPNREQMVIATGFSTDNMSNYMHTFIKFDEGGEPVWYIDTGNIYPNWFVHGGFTRGQVALYLSKNFGIKNEFGIVPPDISKRMALSGALGEKINADAELLCGKYGTKYRDKYITLAEKFRIQEKEPFSAGWEDFQALEILIRKLRDGQRK